MTEEKGIRIAKIIANSGYCSRREAEELIFEGRVKVNGKIIESPATFITDESIKIDNKLINSQSQEIKIWLLHKPAGFLTANKDDKNRKLIFDLLPKEMPRVVTVGRLDFNTEGLLLLTTNGQVARYMELPKTAWIRKYKARVFGKLDNKRLEALEKGITIDGVFYKSIKVKVGEQKGANSWLEISLMEGKNREIRKVMEHLGLQVNRLIRISYGPFNLGDLKVGEVRQVTKAALKNSLPQELLK